MPLPDFLINSSVLICENVLMEADQVPSLIRIVDIYLVSDPPRDAPVNAIGLIEPVVFMKLQARPGYKGTHGLRLRLINVAGKESILVKERQCTFGGKDDTAPTGVSLRVQLNLGVTNLGTCYVCVDLDGAEITRVPITLMRKPNESEEPIP